MTKYQKVAFPQPATLTIRLRGRHHVAGTHSCRNDLLPTAQAEGSAKP